MVVYIANPKESTQKLPRTKEEYSKIAGYNINTKTNYMLLVNTWPPKIKNSIPSTIPKEKKGRGGKAGGKVTRYVSNKSCIAIILEDSTW